MNSLLDNIKSNFFIPRIFDFMGKNVTFKIVNYNKRLQKKLKISMKDFIEIYEIYAPTKIEIIPIKNRYGKFINVNKNDKEYYHIYFNDNNEEIKNKYSIDEEDKVDKIKIIIDYKAKSLRYLFERCNCIESIDFKKYCRKKCYVERIFSGCSSLKELTLSNFYNNEIENMCCFFDELPSVEKINLSNFYNNKADNMNSTFDGCISLKELNATNFYNNEAENMNSTFDGCISLEKINLSNFFNNKGDNMNSTFNRCSSLKELNFINCKNNKTDLFSSFTGCSKDLKINNISLNMYNGNLTLKK